MTDLPPLPQTDWLLHMPAAPYGPAWTPVWTSSQAGYSEDDMRAYAEAAVAAALAEPQGEPVAWRAYNRAQSCWEYGERDDLTGQWLEPPVPLYVAPPAALAESAPAPTAVAEREAGLQTPLTDGEVEAILNDFDVDAEAWKPIVRAVVRAVERAHGIGGER